MILSVDTGLKNYALVVLDGDGFVKHAEVVQSEKSKDKKVRKSDDYMARIARICDHIREVVDTYGVTHLVGEMPSFGAQSSNAAVSLTAGATILIAASEYLQIPLTVADPREIKQSFTGDPNAPKRLIMARCCKIYGWEITYRTVGVRKDPVYHVMGKKLSAGYFEHIADAIAAAHTCRGRLK